MVTLILDDSNTYLSCFVLKEIMETKQDQQIEILHKQQDEVIRNYVELSQYLKSLRSDNLLLESIIDGSIDEILFDNHHSFSDGQFSCLNDILPIKNLLYIDLVPFYPSIYYSILDYECKLLFNNLQYFYNESTKYIEYLNILSKYNCLSEVFTKLAFEKQHLKASYFHDWISSSNGQKMFDYCGKYQDEYFELITIAIKQFPSLKNQISQRILKYEFAFWVYYSMSTRLESLSVQKRVEIWEMMKENVHDICSMFEECSEYMFEEADTVFDMFMSLIFEMYRNTKRRSRTINFTQVKTVFTIALEYNFKPKNEDEYEYDYEDEDEDNFDYEDEDEDDYELDFYNVERVYRGNKSYLNWVLA